MNEKDKKAELSEILIIMSVGVIILLNASLFIGIIRYNQAMQMAILAFTLVLLYYLYGKNEIKKNDKKLAADLTQEELRNKNAREKYRKEREAREEERNRERYLQERKNQEELDAYSNLDEMTQTEFNHIYQNEIKPFVDNLIDKKKYAPDKAVYTQNACKLLREKMACYEMPIYTFNDLYI